MRIYTDSLQSRDIYNAMTDARAEATDVSIDLDLIARRGRRRSRTFNVRLDGHGARHTRRGNSGQYGADGEFAATWMDWGWFIAVLFRYEPTAVIGQYDGLEDFLADTRRTVAYRLGTDASVKNFARRYAAMWPNTHSDPWRSPDDPAVNTSPFALVDTVCPPEHLAVLHPASALEAWLTTN